MMPISINMAMHYLMLIMAIVSSLPVLKIWRDLQNLSEILKLLLENPDGWSNGCFPYLCVENSTIHLYQKNSTCTSTALSYFSHPRLPAFSGLAWFFTEYKYFLFLFPIFGHWIDLFVPTHTRHLLSDNNQQRPAVGPIFSRSLSLLKNLL